MDRLNNAPIFVQRCVIAGRDLSRDESIRWAASLAGAAFLFAVLFVVLVAQPTINVVDGGNYHAIGYTLAHEFYYKRGAYPYPLYPIFLAVIYALGGGFHSVFLVQGALFGVTAGLGYWLARKVAGHVAGLFAAFLIVFDATLLGNVGLIATENLQAPLLLGRGTHIFFTPLRKPERATILGQVYCGGC